VLYLGRDSNGKPRQKWVTVRGTKRDAERRLAELQHELNTGSYVEPSNLSLGQFLERWLDHAQTKVSAKTHERYGEIVRKHLAPALGHIPLEKLRPLHIQSYYDEALKSGRKNGSGGLSAQTVLHHHRVLHGALRQALRWQMLARNPAEAVQPPRPERAAIRVLSEDETTTLLGVAKPTRLYGPVLLAVATGMRRGEILALRWEDVDLAAAKLVVTRTLEQTRAGLSFKQPETAKSRRVVALGPLVVEALRSHRAAQAQERLRLGAAFIDSGLVFPHADGRPWEPDGFTETFLAFARKHGFAGLRFHDLRHTHATQLLRHGMHPKIVSERLGHSTIGITLDTYSHVLPDMQEEAARAADKVLSAALGGA
jgi:integrase